MPFPKVGAPGAALRVLRFGLLASVIVAASHLAGAAASQASPPAAGPSPQAAALLKGKLPVVAEHRYRIAGKIRPLLLFWMGKDNIGSARAQWRKGENGASGYDVLIGSDPDRAPRKINRWGFLLEEADASVAEVVGVMKKSDEDTLEEAKSNVANEAAGGSTFRMIRATVDASESRARVSEAVVTRDYSYRELDALVERLLGAGSAQATRTVAVPPGARPGLLHSLADLLHEGVQVVQASGNTPPRKNVPYIFYRKVYDLTRVSADVEKRATYGGVSYTRLLKSVFELRARGESWVENFSVTCGIDGAASEVPVFMTYQPRWWLKIELVLDENQPF